jgi:ribosome-binding ATPase YchF (GTP1/OBG family)
MTGWREALERGQPLRQLGLHPNDLRELKTAGLISGKPVLYIANIAGEGDEHGVSALTEREPDTRLLAVDAELELELAELETEERAEFMSELGFDETGLDRVVRASFDLLGLIAFYTIAKSKLQAWEIPRGTPAATAAGKIHSDMEKGFIRAKVASSEELIEAGNLQEIQSRGHVRTVGRDHEICDGDVVEFFFSG